jgi:phosphate/sulfate permease
MNILLFIVGVLLVLAVIDLIVGVSNDAVNFLNSAIGSKVASFKTIIIIAACGIILGSLFSNGIMEIARKGIFNPSFFTLDVLLMIFLAVMLTDILLLDIFNSLGLPTSTTVSIVFELLGAAIIAGVIVSIDKSMPVKLNNYINASSVISIVSSIFLSILLAFTSGTLVQYLSRLLFTFDYEKKLKKYGSLFASIGLTSIIYFLLVKGLKGSSLISKDFFSYIQQHTFLILLGVWLLALVNMLIAQFLFKVNPLKILVLSGTFALAMAFAGNDLVNFIGVPITGFIAYTQWTQNPVPLNESYQTYLAGNDIVVPNYMLLISGIIMALTIWLSSKARKVTETEVSLGSEGNGEEHFQPTNISRSIVKTSLLISKIAKSFFPDYLAQRYNIGLKKERLRSATIIHDRPAFDLVRASVNLMLASSLIALATSYKLPLSTTYVSFMVAMGASLADKAWGRESAVYRVAGVLSVIGGWFITAFMAFGVSALFVFILLKGGTWGMGILISFVSVFIVFSHLNFNYKEKKNAKQKSRLDLLSSNTLDVFNANKLFVVNHLSETKSNINKLFDDLINYDEKEVSQVFEQVKTMSSDSIKLRVENVKLIKRLSEKDLKEAQILLLSTDLLHDMTTSMLTMTEEVNYYIKNLHEQSDFEFLGIVESLKYKVDTFLSLVIKSIKNDDFSDFELIKLTRDDVRTFVNQQLVAAIKTTIENDISIKEAMLKTTILLQTRDILAVTLRIMKMYKSFVK